MRGFTSLLIAAGLLGFGSLATATATYAGARGWGADDTLSQQVSVRGGSAGAGRVYLGGGLRGGK